MWFVCFFLLLNRPWSLLLSDYIACVSVCVWVCDSFVSLFICHRIFVFYYWFKFTRKICFDGFLFRSNIHGCIDVCMFAKFFLPFLSLLKSDLFNWQKDHDRLKWMCIYMCVFNYREEKIPSDFEDWKTTWTFCGGIGFCIGGATRTIVNDSIVHSLFFV